MIDNLNEIIIYAFPVGVLGSLLFWGLGYSINSVKTIFKTVTN